MSDKLLFSPAEAAKMLGIARSTLYLIMESGGIASVRIGRARRIHVDEIRRVASEGATAA